MLQILLEHLLCIGAYLGYVDDMVPAVELLKCFSIISKLFFLLLCTLYHMG